MRIFTQPTMPCHFKEICPFSWIGDEDSPKEVTSMWSNIFGESERGRNDIFVKQIDVVAFGVCWIIIKGKIACKHSILASQVSKISALGEKRNSLGSLRSSRRGQTPRS